MMILCDTNIFIEVYRGNAETINILKKIGQQNLAISDVTRAELIYVARNKRELHAISKDTNSLQILPIDETISGLAVELVSNFSLTLNLNLPDALIAATSLSYGISLYTLNIKDFKFIPGISLYFP